VSDIVTQLEAKGLLERQTDPGDRRRTLVWLTSEGFDHLERDREVLATQLLARAFAGMAAAERSALLRGLAALLDADDTAGRRACRRRHRPTDGPGPSSPRRHHDRARPGLRHLLRELRHADRDRPLLRALHGRRGPPPAVRRALRADGRLAVASREDLERATLAYMATMPAWRDHPAVRAS
jgi:hypothetical protein